MHFLLVARVFFDSCVGSSDGPNKKIGCLYGATYLGGRVSVLDLLLSLPFGHAYVRSVDERLESREVLRCAG